MQKNLLISNKNPESYHNFSLAECTIDTISTLIHKLMLNYAAGVDGISAEDFCYYDSSIKKYICDLFNMCLYHGVIPKSCTDILLVPIIKNKNVDDVSNYRPIALTTVVSKLFESYMLHHLMDFLKTNDNQFGFEPNRGTDMSVFLLKLIASSYVSRNTPVFAVFLDVSKASDKVDHDLLFNLFIYLFASDTNVHRQAMTRQSNTRHKSRTTRKKVNCSNSSKKQKKLT